MLVVSLLAVLTKLIYFAAAFNSSVKLEAGVAQTLLLLFGFEKSGVQRRYLTAFV